MNYRANLWALHSLGVRRVLGPSAVGSLQAHLRPGEFVVCDQLVDRTRGRADTFFDGPAVHSIPFADPYCTELRSVAVAAAQHEGIATHDGGTVVIWLLNGGQVTASIGLGITGTDWHIAGTGDFDGDGKGDILWRHDSGVVAIWEMNGGQVKASLGVATVGTDWHIQDATAGTPIPGAAMTSAARP